MHPEHMLLPGRQYIGRMPMPWAFSRRHLVARQIFRCWGQCSVVSGDELTVLAME